MRDTGHRPHGSAGFARSMAGCARPSGNDGLSATLRPARLGNQRRWRPLVAPEVDEPTEHLWMMVRSDGWTQASTCRPFRRWSQRGPQSAEKTVEYRLSSARYVAGGSMPDSQESLCWWTDISERSTSRNDLQLSGRILGSDDNKDRNVVGEIPRVVSSDPFSLSDYSSVSGQQ